MMREHYLQNLSSVVGGFSLILCFLPLFFSKEVTVFYTPIIQSIFLLAATIVALILTVKNRKDDRRHLLPFTLTLALLFIAEVMVHNTIVGYDPNVIFILEIIVQVITLVALLPLYVILVLDIRKTQKHVPRSFKLGSLLVTVIVLLALSPLISVSSKYFIQNEMYFEFIFSILFIIIDADIVAITATFVYMQFKVKKPYLWILVCLSWIFRLIADAVVGYFVARDLELVGSIPEYLYSISYALVLIGLITISERYEKPLSVLELELERKQYQALYEDMNVFAKDLVTVTSILRHDLLNDLVVIQSGIDLYQETGKKEYLERVIQRTDTVAERMDILKSESMLLESLAIQPITLDAIQSVSESFANLEIISLPRDVKVNANRLLYPVVFNVIQNATNMEAIMLMSK